MAARTGASSLTQRTYGLVRAAILQGRLTPGQRVRPGELASEHGVSINVVREVLNRLAGERLVQASPQQGFTVVGASAVDLADLTDLRVLVETAALRRSIERGSVGWESEVVAAHHLLARTPIPGPDGPEGHTDEWSAAHTAFHAATMSACGSPRMIETIVGLGQCAALYRHWSHRVDQGQRDLVAEHRGIFEATVERDTDLAVRLHEEHLRRTVDIVLAAIDGDGPDAAVTATH